MSDANPKTNANTRKRKYRSDGTPTWEKPMMDGPGVWITCVKGKEKQTVGEVYDLFESLAADLWPESQDISELGSGPESNKDSIEDRLANEIASIRRPRKDRKTFVNCQTNTPCVIFMSCKTPVDPVQLIEAHIKNVKNTGITRTRYAHRFVPVSGSCTANILEIGALCRRICGPFFTAVSGSVFTYKVELRFRNHTVLKRPAVIQAIADCVPSIHKVDLTNPQVFILVEIFKSICGISITKEYYELNKFNVVEIAQTSSAVQDANG